MAGSGNDPSEAAANRADDLFNQIAFAAYAFNGLWCDKNSALFPTPGFAVALANALNQSKIT